MAGFDPDAYLATPARPGPKPFDPDAFLSQPRGPEAQPAEPVTVQPVEDQDGPPLRERFIDAASNFSAATFPGNALPRGAQEALGGGLKALLRGEGLGGAADAAGKTWAEERASSAPSPGESLRRGGAQGASLGFSDELAGLASSGLGYARDTAKRVASGNLDGITGDDMVRMFSRYMESRDGSRAKDDAARKANPGLFLTGEIAGGSVIPGGASASGTGLAARIGRGMLAGGAAGAVQGIGTSRGENMSEVLRDGTKGGAIGAAVGGTIPVIGAGASRAIDALPQSLKDTAAEYALRASGYIGNDFKRLVKGGGQKAVQERGRELLDAGVIPVGGTVSDVLERIGPAKHEAGEAVGGFVERAAQTGKQFDLAPFVGRVQDEIINPNMSSPAVRPMAQRVSGHLDELMDVALPDGGRVPFPLAQKWKTDSQGVLNYGNPWNNAGPNIPADSMNKDLTRILKESLDDQVEGALGPGTAARFQGARRRYGALADAEDRAREGVARLAGNNKASQTDLKIGELMSKAAESVPFVGPLAVGGSRMVRQRADSLLARGADAAADLAATPGGTRFRQLAAALAESGAITPAAARALVAQQEAEEAQGPRAPAQ